jgi:lipoate-protein ligase B
LITLTPCGIAGVTMTSIEKETGVALSVEEVGKRMAAVAEERIEQLERF